MRLPHWRHVARVLHRDLGYFFFGATVVYGVSGVAINHRHDWDPSYSIVRVERTVNAADLPATFTRESATALLRTAGLPQTYLKHYTPTADQVRIFYQGGTATLDRTSGKLVTETLQRRPVLHLFNKLHYNPGRWWTWYSDAFCGALLVVALTGLVLLRGRQGIGRRGGVVTALGVLLPGVLILSFL
ncbi:PepSY-associated TM helix domain-containing protein [Opitutus sp. ER46]|uniref:PepSY-associated TM helix domain-containing protein n=1 Tax=Opitutus sp. ER46 TaxID=2161864 RepID=UPI000D31092B|nr:PepSY-associated TM helix domain-containing protein [Opitutus sp. ER46]PTX96521.1 peptidase [Opitutus sp. ER46]